MVVIEDSKQFGYVRPLLRVRNETQSDKVLELLRNRHRVILWELIARIADG